MHVHPAQFCAAAKLREHLAWIEQAVWVEGALESLLLIQVSLTELYLHQIALLDADAVLAREYAANLDAVAEDVGSKGLGLLDLPGQVCVIADQGVQVAIAGVEDVGDP